MRERIDQIIETGQFACLVDVLNGAKIHEFRYAARRIGEMEQGDVLLERATQLTSAPETAPRRLACQLVQKGYQEDRGRTLKLLMQLAEDEDQIVRDTAGEACGRLLRDDFSAMVMTLRDWREHPSTNVRRAVVTATLRAASSHHPERAEPLLKLIEPLLEASEPRLRRCLGPSTLGTHLLRHYPMLTFEYLVKWSTSNDPNVLWNVAMAFSAPPAAPIVKKALIVLRKLSLDERRFVWRAVSSAMWKLGRRRPEIVRPELTRWLEDGQRADVAREAIKHL